MKRIIFIFAILIIIGLVFLSPKEELKLAGDTATKPTLTTRTENVSSNSVDFVFDWQDDDDEMTTFYVCYSPATSTGGCDSSGEVIYSSSTKIQSGVSPVRYLPKQGERGRLQEYYAFICSSEGNETVCTDSQPVTFTTP